MGNLLELMCDELRNMSPLLYIKNESLYILHLMKFYKETLEESTCSSILGESAFFTAKGLKKAVESSIRSSFNFDKRKGLMMLYHLIQFRNYKATSFNILYLAVADVLKRMWKDEACINEVVEQIMLTFKANLHSEKGKTQDFFDMEAKTVIRYSSEMYQRMLQVCEELFLESSQTTESVQDDAEALDSSENAAEQSKRSSVTELLLAFYDSKHLKEIIELINQEAAGKCRKARVITLSKESFLCELYELSLIHICRCRRYAVCRSRWSPYH
eukprot:TRINITY_DN11216_c0_g2_i1.p1 TRINITY_DN11216_c0_g2~~TRINITY_DN11216_c0_g2_i1.p1  ORF type:complete len:272 (-),score=88.45 TRINITY_DN11216_c0_g2_i1:22-837(-)